MHACFEGEIRKNIFYSFFPQFLPFQCEASGRALFASGRVWLSRWDGSVTRPDARGPNGRKARLHFRTCPTCLHISKATGVWMGLMSLPDGDPTASIKPGRRIFSLPRSFSLSLLAVCECLLARFCFFSPFFFCPAVHYSPHSRYFFFVNIILFSFF
jgi:hypothetical protein